MKQKTVFGVIVCITLVLIGCRDNHGFKINGRINADVKVTNVTTGVVWHGESKGIVQSVGEDTDETLYDVVAHIGDVLQVNYSPYSHFAKGHSVSMTTHFVGTNIETVTHAPYEVKFTISPEVPKDIHVLTIVGISGSDCDECFLNERRSIRVKIE